MVRVSKNTAVKVAAAAASSLLTGTAIQTIYGRPGASSAAAVAVLLAQSNSILNSVNLGAALSTSKRDIIHAVSNVSVSSENPGELENKLRRALQGNSGDLENKLKQALDENRESITSKLSAILVKPVAAAANSSIAKAALPDTTKTFPAADPKQRRTGAPAPKFPKPEVMASRLNSPIVGKSASKWIASRTGGEAYTPENSVPAFRAGGRPFARDIPVAMIADEFTYHSFKEEFDAVRLLPNKWKEQFEKHQPQMFFCESAWQGGTPKEHPLQAKIYASVRWPKENRTELLEILDYCHKHNIPTVFWNKEDPTHFDDRINDFIRTAALFDYVFTTAEECVDSYIKNVGCNHADVLPFAVQPKLFNPQGIADAKDTANFAGTWYANYPRRCEAASAIMDASLDAGLDLVIYNRMYRSSSPRHQYPEKYAKYTRPAIPYTQTAEAFKECKFGITLNTVDDSNSMFARRVFELAASGSVVLSNSAKGVKNFFGDTVLYPDVEPGALLDLSDSEYRRLQTESMAIALDHTYTARAETILKTVGIDFQPALQTPTAFVSVGSIAEYEAALEKKASTKVFDDLLVSIREDGEQSLEFKLGMRHDPNVSVIRERDLGSGIFRTRSFLNTPSLIKVDATGNWPDASDVKNLLRHSQHFSGVIKATPQTENRFMTSDEPVTTGSYVPADKITSLASNSGPTSTFHF